MSHLACADEDSPANARQLEAFRARRRQGPRATRSASPISAGICLGADYAFGLTRPGLALYGGVPRRRRRRRRHLRQVARVEAADPPAAQRRGRREGRLWRHLHRAAATCELAILNIGYADGYLRGFSSEGGSLGRRHGRRSSGGSRWTCCRRNPASRDQQANSGDRPTGKLETSECVDARGRCRRRATG